MMNFRACFFVATSFVCLGLVSSWSLPIGPGKSFVLLQLGSKKTENQGVKLKSSKSVASDGTKGVETKQNAGVAILSSLSSQSAAYAIGGTAITYFLNNILSLGAVPASSLTGLLAARFFSDKMALAAFCGSFAGMAKTSVIPNIFSSFVLGACCAVMLHLFDKKKWLVGVGGRLGFIAQCACTVQFIVASLLGFKSEGAALVGALPPLRTLVSEFPKVSFFTVVGALFTSYCKDILARESKDAGTESAKAFYQQMSTSVAAVGATGLLASIVLPASLVGPTVCGSFIAMSSPDRLATYGSLIGASIMGGVAQLMLAGTLLGGWGGKLGTASLLGVLMLNKLGGSDKTVVRTTKTSALEKAVPV
jgi:hypothetical protein